MTPDQAKLILSSCRPNGQDDHDPAFQEALELASRDPELSHWLADEKAQDSQFAENLSALPIPEALREELFEILASGISSPGYDELDISFATALGALSPPPELRADILAAMAVEQKVTALPKKETAPANSRKFGIRGIALAAAAGIVAALIWNLNPPSPVSPALVSQPLISNDKITPASIRSSTIELLSNNFELDLRNSNQEALYQYLTSNKLPSPEALPEGLREIPGVGCKEVQFGSHPASLICFRKSAQEPTVHLIVFQKDEVEGELPTLADAKGSCVGCEKTGWSMAKWSNNEQAFFLMSQMEPTQLASIF